jgi:hypothetical protein
MGFPQALSETRAIQAEIPTNLVGNLSHSLYWKAFPQSLSEGYTIHNLAIRLAESHTISVFKRIKKSLAVLQKLRTEISSILELTI